MSLFWVYLNVWWVCIVDTIKLLCHSAIWKMKWRTYVRRCFYCETANHFELEMIARAVSFLPIRTCRNESRKCPHHKQVTVWERCIHLVWGTNLWFCLHRLHHHLEHLICFGSFILHWVGFVSSMWYPAPIIYRPLTLNCCAKSCDHSDWQPSNKQAKKNLSDYTIFTGKLRWRNYVLAMWVSLAILRTVRLEIWTLDVLPL